MLNLARRQRWLGEAVLASRLLTLLRFPPLLTAESPPEAHHHRPHQNVAPVAIDGAFDHLNGRVKRLPIFGFKSASAIF